MRWNGFAVTMILHCLQPSLRHIGQLSILIEENKDHGDLLPMDEHEEDVDPKTLEDFLDTIFGGVVAIVLVVCSSLIVTTYLVNLLDFIRTIFNG